MLLLLTTLTESFAPQAFAQLQLKEPQTFEELELEEPKTLGEVVLID